MAMNAADPHHYSFKKQLLPLAVEKQMGIIGMKIPGRGRLLSTLDAAVARGAEALVGRDGARDHAGHADHAGGDVLHAFAAGEHDHRRMRFDCAA